jgi:hypothetical protein
MRAILPRTKRIAHHILLVSLYYPIIYKKPSEILTFNDMFEMQKRMWHKHGNSMTQVLRESE